MDRPRAADPLPLSGNPPARSAFEIASMNPPPPKYVPGSLIETGRKH